MLVAQILNLLYSIVDRVYIGRIPGSGTTALGAVGLCFPIIIIINGFTNMFGMGGAPLFSMELGRAHRQKAETILNTAFRLLTVSALVITAAGELFAGPLLRLFGAAADRADLVHGLLRDDEVAGNEVGDGIDRDAMGHGPDPGRIARQGGDFGIGI